jgi:GR25 family glycosyltransferase involved in LPS biosynthesis
MPVSVISLPSDPARRRAFDARMAALGPYTYFDAFSPEAIEDFKPYFHASDIYRYTAYTKPEAVIACAKSHYYQWKKCLASQQNLLILEDDAMFATHQSPEILSRIQPPQTFDVLFLDGEKTDGEINMVKSTGFHGCYAYLLSPKGAAILLDEIAASGFSAAVDWQILNMQKEKLSVWMTDGAIFVHDENFPSNIKQKSQVAVY